jgi:hypothetical protein
MAAKTCSLSSGHENGADPSGSQRLATAAAGICGLDAIGVVAQSKTGWRDGGGEIDCRLSRVPAPGRESLHLCDQRPVDGLQLGREGPLGRHVEPAPEGQQMLLPNTLETGDEIWWGIHPRTHLQNNMHRSGKPTKITV